MGNMVPLTALGFLSDTSFSFFSDLPWIQAVLPQCWMGCQPGALLLVFRYPSGQHLDVRHIFSKTLFPVKLNR